MSKQVLKPSRWEWPQILAWLLANREKNNLDPKMMDYPTLQVLSAVEDGQTLAYLPYHAGVIMDSMAWSPEASAQDKAESAIVVIEAIEKQAFNDGAREVFYVSSDDRTDEFMGKLGYVKTICYRKRLK